MNYEIGAFSERWRGDRIVKKWNLFLKFISQQPPDFAIQFHLSERSKKRGGGTQTRYITSGPVHVWSNNKSKGGKHAGWCLQHCASSSQAAANPKDCFYSAASLNQQIHIYTTTQTKEASICIHLIFYFSNFQRQVSITKSYFSLPKLTFPLGSRVAE